MEDVSTLSAGTGIEGGPCLPGGMTGSGAYIALFGVDCEEGRLLGVGGSVGWWGILLDW